MMDLIKQFAIDCAGQKEWDFPKDPKSYTFTPDELEKFAELIVRKCVLISRTSTDGFAAGRRMEEHFGVKE
jgi:hypothetical protein